MEVSLRTSTWKTQRVPPALLLISLSKTAIWPKESKQAPLELAAKKENIRGAAAVVVVGGSIFWVTSIVSNLGWSAVTPNCQKMSMSIDQN